MTDTGITVLNILPTHCSSPTSCFASRHMFTPTLVAAFWKRRNITPPFHIDKAADCSLYPAANVLPFLSKKGCCWPIRFFQVKNSSNIFWASCTIQNGVGSSSSVFRGSQGLQYGCHRVHYASWQPTMLSVFLSFLPFCLRSLLAAPLPPPAIGLLVVVDACLCLFVLSSVCASVSLSCLSCLSVCLPVCSVVVAGTDALMPVIRCFISTSSSVGWRGLKMIAGGPSALE